jgi:RNA polymerase sigma factor (sigma-70 family)
VEQATERVALGSNVVEHDEWQLLDRISQGDRHALAELYARYRQPLFQYILKLTSDIGLAEEVLQDTFVAAWQSASTFQKRSSVLTWLIGIARRQGYNALRNQNQECKWVSDDALQSVPAPDLEPEVALIVQQTRAEFTTAFDQLSLPHQEILTLIFVHHLSYQEAAQVIDIPIGTVRSRLNHARRALRIHLQDEQERAK